MITMLAIFAGVILFVLWSFRDADELFDGGAEVYSYGINLAVGFIVSYIFFYLNFLIPKKKELRSSLIYVGECIGTICFNEISRVRAFEPHIENLKIMNIMGVKYQIRDIDPGNLMSIQEDINKENAYLLNNLLEMVDKNAFQLRVILVEMLNSLFPLIAENYRMTECHINAEDKAESFIKIMSCKRYSGKSNIGAVSKSSIDRLNYLIESESKMRSINTAIQFGESD